MAGTQIGGVHAAATNIKLYGPDYYARIGKIGGSKEKDLPGGFGSDKVGKDGLTGRQRASQVGKIGGRKSWDSRRRNDAEL